MPLERIDTILARVQERMKVRNRYNQLKSKQDLTDNELVELEQLACQLGESW